MATITEIFKAQKAKVPRGKKRAQPPVAKGRPMFRIKFNIFSPFLFEQFISNLLCYMCFWEILHNVYRCRISVYS